ncbi:MAG: exodeoxyribonuclease VII small subunit [Eubacteriales bacterium]|nr:exodeoxyribonuclease VII small subunit [Eubacteriales bacterium]
MNETKEKSFQESLQALEQAAEKIGQPATSLEDSLKLFDQGIQESEYLNRILEEAEQKIEIYEAKEDGHESL